MSAILDYIEPFTEEVVSKRVTKREGVYCWILHKIVQVDRENVPLFLEKLLFKL